jgi:hypothetical protein
MLAFWMLNRSNSMNFVVVVISIAFFQKLSGLRYPSQTHLNNHVCLKASLAPFSDTIRLIAQNLFLPVSEKNLEKVSQELAQESRQNNLINAYFLKINQRSILSQLLRNDRTNYLNVVSTYGALISRTNLPNRQDVPILKVPNPRIMDSEGIIHDCALPNITYSESLLDKVLLSIFRQFVREEISFKSSTKGIKGLLEEGRHFMLSEEGTPENQHAFVRTVLERLLTPFMPPLYRLFMAGIIPSRERKDPHWLVNAAEWLYENSPEPIKKYVTPGACFKYTSKIL